MIKLDERLYTVAQMLVSSDTLPKTVCDVGTDHGYIAVYLVQNGVKKVIATDISSPSAEKARASAGRYGLSQSIDVRVGNGLETISDYEADAVIIAGMGGQTITEILSNVPKGVERFVLQPMKSDYELRKWLCGNGFVIKDEQLALEGDKLYNIILAEYGNEPYTGEFDLYIGKKLTKGNNPHLAEYYIRRLNSLNKKIDGRKRAGYAEDISLTDFKHRLEMLINKG